MRYGEGAHDAVTKATVRAGSAHAHGSKVTRYAS
jgi:hypothetical protein